MSEKTTVKKIKNMKGIQITENMGGDGAFREVVDAVIGEG